MLKGTIIHPQWLSDRYHIRSKKRLEYISNKVILDVGSGNSVYSKKLVDDNQFIKLDYPATNQRYAKLPDIYADVCQLPFKNESIDVILFLEVLEHVNNHEIALTEINRVTKRNGKLFVSVPFIYPIHDAPYDFRRYTIFGIKDEIERHGFNCLEIAQHGNSFIVSIQLFNLSILETIRELFIINKYMGYIFSIFLLPICVVMNILSIAFLKLPILKASCFGYFLIAKKEYNINA